MIDPLPNPRAESGFALLVLLVLTAATGLVATLALEPLVRPRTDQAAATALRLATIARAAGESRRLAGSFPARLVDLPTVADADAVGDWRRDPWRPAADLVYRVRSRDLEIRSRGPDGRSGTADDVVAAVDDEPFVRLRQRARLRILRAVFASSPFRSNWMMSPADSARMRAAMRDHAAARRTWYSATADAREVLLVRMADAQAVVDSLVASYGLPAAPTQLQGAGGLLAALGLPAGRAVDGLGRPFDVDPVVGFAARGGDRRRNTDDDM